MNRATAREFYQSPTWRRAARACRARAGWLCVRCKAEGYTVAAALAHHRIPLDQNGPPLAETNLEAICHRHHQEAHGCEPNEEQRAWGKYVAELRRTI